MICIKNLRYRSLGIDHLPLEPGFTIIIGPNGSGKTTLLRLLAGIVVPESGMILIDGIPPRDTEIGWVNEFPDRNILFGKVYDEIASPLRFRHLPDRRIRERVESCLESMGISLLQNREMRELSGGEKVLVALAAALVLKPRVLILDEYDSHLDEYRRDTIFRIIRASAIPYIIYCTQDMETAARGDYLVFLKEGTVDYAGDPGGVFASLAKTPFFPLSWRWKT